MPDVNVKVDPNIDPAIQEAVADARKDAPDLVDAVKKQDVVGVLTAGTRAYQDLAPLIPTITQETKAGYKTTEFWALIVWEAATQSELIHLPGSWGKLIAGVGAVAAYILSRGWAKSGVPNQVPLLK